jgi:hypothetical protein
LPARIAIRSAPDGLLKLAGRTSSIRLAGLRHGARVRLLGGIAGAGTYDFAVGLDLGSVQRVRLTSLLGIHLNVNDLIDQRTGDVDDWEDWDGTAGASADAYIEVRETDDDPASSPSWSAGNVWTQRSLSLEDSISARNC